MKEKMISANMTKKIFPKINAGSSTSKVSLSMYNLDSRSKHNMLPIQLSAKGNSSSDSQVYCYCFYTDVILFFFLINL